MRVMPERCQRGEDERLTNSVKKEVWYYILLAIVLAFGLLAVEGLALRLLGLLAPPSSLEGQIEPLALLFLNLIPAGIMSRYLIFGRIRGATHVHAVNRETNQDG